MVKKILKFSATWCAPCKAFEATLNKLKDTDDFKDIEIQSINIEGDDDELDLVEKYQIRSVPTTILLDENGETLYKVLGNIPMKDFASIVQEVNNKENKPNEDKA